MYRITITAPGAQGGVGRLRAGEHATLADAICEAQQTVEYFDRAGRKHYCVKIRDGAGTVVWRDKKTTSAKPDLRLVHRLGVVGDTVVH